MEAGTSTTIRKSAGFPSDLLIDLRSAGPRRLSERLEQDLRAAIQAGRLAGGAAVPPSRVLAAELGVSRTTVLRAYGNLVADGYLEARRGSGTESAGIPRVRPHVGRRAAAGLV